MTTDTAAQNTATAVHANASSQAPAGPGVRLAVDELAPHISKAMNALEGAARKISLEPSLLELVRARASQINGCAYCVDMHSRDARAADESERRLYALPVWRETPFFTPRERAALALTESGTKLSEGEVPDSVFAAAAEQFTETELAELIWVIAVINAWNRVGVIARPWAV